MCSFKPLWAVVDEAYIVTTVSAWIVSIEKLFMLAWRPHESDRGRATQCMLIEHNSRQTFFAYGLG